MICKKEGKKLLRIARIQHHTQFESNFNGNKCSDLVATTRSILALCLGKREKYNKNKKNK